MEVQLEVVRLLSVERNIKFYIRYGVCEKAGGDSKLKASQILLEQCKKKRHKCTTIN